MSTKLDCENIARLAVILARYTKSADTRIASAAVALAKIGRQLHTLAEIDCNEGLDARRAKRWDNLQRKAGVILQDLWPLESITSYTQGDPRGYCLRLRFPGGESNNLGGDFGV